MSDPKIIVDCVITAHASPRWKAARNEQERVQKNEQLARERGQKVKGVIEQQLRTKLSGFDLDFKFDQTISDEDSLPKNTVVIGDVNRGQRDSIVATGGDTKNDEAKYRRVDVEVRIARKTEEFYPTEVVHKYDQPTKTKFWYVSVGGAVGLHVGAGVNLLFVELENMWNQKATGVAYAAGVGVGVSGIGEAISKMTKDQLMRAAASASFSDATSFSTDNDVGFDDFHVRRIRYTSAGIQLIVGAEASYITFSNMGKGAESISVGGVSLGADAGVSLSTGVGLLYLFNVPSDWIIREYTMTEWNSSTSKWVTNLSASLSFESGKSDVTKLMTPISEFTTKVEQDFRSK